MVAEKISSNDMYTKPLALASSVDYSNASIYKDSVHHAPIVQVFEGAFENKEKLFTVDQPAQLLQAVTWIYMTSNDQGLVERIRSTVKSHFHQLHPHMRRDELFIAHPKIVVEGSYVCHTSILRVCPFVPYYDALLRFPSKLNEWKEKGSIRLDIPKEESAQNDEMMKLLHWHFTPQEAYDYTWSDEEIYAIAQQLDMTGASKEFDQMILEKLRKIRATERGTISLYKLATLARLEKSKTFLSNAMKKLTKYAQIQSFLNNEQKWKEEIIDRMYAGLTPQELSDAFRKGRGPTEQWMTDEEFKSGYLRALRRSKNQRRDIASITT